MADTLNWGILATGSIARQFAGGLGVSKTGRLVSVGSRTIESATAFTEKYGGNPVAGYESVLADPAVEAVYIALPHHLHSEWTIKCANAGKAVLCEKPFTLNALEAQRTLDVVRERKVFFMEAFMYRCHPQTLKVKELVDSGAIGKVLNVNGEFGFHASESWDNFRAEGALGGGGLLDVGTYCVSFTRLVVGEEPVACHYVARITEKGYDAHGSGCMKFPGGATAHFGTGIHASLRNDFRIYGTKGWICVDQPWKCGEGSSIELYRNGEPKETFQMPSTNDELYAMEADMVAKYLEAGECPFVTLQDTLSQMRSLDALRASAGLRFAMEPTE